MTDWSAVTRRSWETRRARSGAAPVGRKPPETPEEKQRRLDRIGRSTRRALEERRAAAKAARPHFIADVRMRVREGAAWTLCVCGMRFEEGSIEATAEAFNRHSYEARYQSRSGPVESSFDDAEAVAS